MSESEVLSPVSNIENPAEDSPAAPAMAPARKRPKPGERREQILQALASMLEKPGADRIPRRPWLPI
jgi:TetR/AcrR family transcriptional regulator